MVQGRRRRGLARTLVTVTIGLSVTLGLVNAAPAPAQEDPDVTQAREKLQAAQEEANAAHNRYQKAVEDRDQVQGQIAGLEQAIPELRAQEAVLRAQLSIRAAALYKNTNPAVGLDVLTARSHLRAGRKTKLTEAADAFDNERARQLRETADRLEQAQRELEAKRAQLQEILPRLEQEKAVFDQKVAVANRALEVAEEIGALRALGEPVMGPTILTPQEMVAWYRSSGASPRLSAGMSIDQLAQIFVEEGTAENVRADFAFAQSYVETGGFRAGGGDNNFSGLGACDGCSGETSFPTARDGVRAQIQHLRNYADHRSVASDLHNPPSPFWYGSNPATAARNFDTFFAKGWAPTWQMMGHGNWATDPNYASKVIGVYNRMIASRSKG
ncbi:MAG TPA: glucosaminidase domain-containing protein [Acidimicrobiia bacterium]|nr:glucosaminidase domain-containing protein [Acidimicrobiia bacterium]